jgi:hypothetical protein
MVEFFEDYYIKDPSARLDKGDGATKVTGDPLIDKWERELADGLVPDLSEGMTPVEHEDFMKWSEDVYKKKQEFMTFRDEPDMIRETY